MPKPKISIEEKILDYFQTASLDAARVTLRFATKTVRDREPKPEVPVKPAPKPRMRKTNPRVLVQDIPAMRDDPPATAARSGEPLFKD